MKKTVKILCAILALVCICPVLSSCVSAERKAEIKATIEAAEAASVADIETYIDALEVEDFEKSSDETNYVMIEIENYGSVVVALRPDVAPISAKNFKDLVSDGFYNGLIFHRVIKDFMIQGGGYTTGYKLKDADAIKGEFSSNGVENNLLHYRGVLSMARTSVKDSASSQFFIMHKTSPHLDGEYAAFGYVIAGLNTVDKVANVTTGYNDNPSTKVVIKSAYFVSPITD